MKNKKLIYILSGILIFGIIGFWAFKKFNYNSNDRVGQPVDSLNHVYVYFNGTIGNITGRNISADGYNLGLKYQCVEFVKRYYYQYLNHKMPDSYGNAVDFYDKSLTDGQHNKKRNLTQYTNPSNSKPKADDLLIYSGTPNNKYGHVAIISKVTENEIEIIQQNPGPTAQSRMTFKIENQNGKWNIVNNRILGWLRKE